PERPAPALASAGLEPPQDSLPTRRSSDLVVKIGEPSIEIAVHMLRGVVPALEQHHGVRILDTAVVEAVELSARYVTGRQLPDKCVSDLDTACARVALSLASEPAAITDVTHLLDNLSREENAIQRAGESTRTRRRVNEIKAHREQLHRLHDELRTDYEIQLQLVREIRKLRMEITALTRSLESSSTNLASRASKSTPRRQAEQLDKKLNKTLEKLQVRHKERALVYECVDASTVCEVISGWTGIPLGRMIEDELAAVQQLDASLQQRVIGQDHAPAQIAQRIQISKANL